MLKVFVLVLSVVLVSPSFGSSPETPDIVGVRIGHTIEQARRAIQTHNAGLVTGEAASKKVQGNKSPSVILFAGTADDIRARKGFGYLGRDFGEFIQVTLGKATEKAYYVARRVGDRAQERIPMKNFEDALIAKYGTPSRRHVSAMAGSMRWETFPGGTVRPMQQSCDVGGLETAPSELNGVPLKECGVIVTATWHADKNAPSLVSMYFVALLDHQVWLRDREEMARQQSPNDDRVKADIEKSTRHNIPKL